MVLFWINILGIVKKKAEQQGAKDAFSQHVR